MRRFPLGIIGGALLALSVISRADTAAKTDAFLDQPFGTNLKLDDFWAPSADGKGPAIKYSGLRMGSLREQIELLGRLSGKRIVLPDYITTALVNDEGKGDGSSFLGVGKDQTVREIFNRVCFSMGMVWRYEPQVDDIVLDTKWRRDDLRAGAALVAVLNDESPAPWDKLLWGPVNIVEGHDQILDSWRIAFDALLSKSENLSTAGQVRINHDSRARELSPFPVDNLFSRKMKDRSGRQETLVLNTQSPMMNKDAPRPVAYYLFDEEGRFIKGGIYAMGEGAVGMVGQAKADSDNIVTIDVGWGSFAMNPDHVHFVLVNGDLVLQGATDSKGNAMSIEEVRTAGAAQHWHGAMGVLKFSVVGPGRA